MDPVSCRTSECIPLFSGGVGDKYGKSIQRFLSLMALKICRAGCENGLPIHRKEEHMDLNDLKIDPEFEEKIPPLTEDEFSLLEQNIVADGEVLDPLIVWNNTILDGHNRYRILKKHSEIPFKTFPKEFPDKYAAIAWICRNQLGRRNLTPEQKRYLVGKQYKAEKASHGAEDGFRGNRFTGGLVSPQNEDLLESTKTSERIAKENGTSKSYVERAEKYADGVDAADEVLPGMRKELLSGTIHPTQSAVTAVARAAPEDRAELAK